MKKNLNTLHIASFTGNVGDNANHNGTRRLLNEHTDFKYDFTESEIRRYYQNYQKKDKRSFDEEFVERANEHDVVFIGSGNFFELWIEESVTGTTVDLDPDLVSDISTPVIFYGLGCDPHKGVPGDNASKFQRFLNAILESENCFVSVRNDGSIQNIREHFGDKYAKEVFKVPDGGFFCEVDDSSHPELQNTGPHIAVNVAQDMPDMRFPQEGEEYHTYNSFTSEMARALDEFLSQHPEGNITFMPHIYSDIGAVGDTINQMENMHRRSQVSVAPYLNGEGSERYIFDVYRKVDAATGLRFHTNVCSIGQMTPTIGLVSYPKVGDLYQELGIENRTVDVRNKGFAEELVEKINNSVDQSDIISDQYQRINNDLEKQAESVLSQINEHLHKFY